MNPRMLQMLKQLKENPLRMLTKKYSIPENVGTDPNKIIQYLLNSGQVSQEQVNQAMQMRNSLM